MTPEIEVVVDLNGRWRIQLSMIAVVAEPELERERETGEGNILIANMSCDHNWWSNLQLWLWGPEAEAWFKGLIWEIDPPPKSCCYHVTEASSCDFLRCATGKYCFHHCCYCSRKRCAFVALVILFNIFLQLNFDFWRTFISLIHRWWRCVNRLVELCCKRHCFIVYLTSNTSVKIVSNWLEQEKKSIICCGLSCDFTYSFLQSNNWLVAYVPIFKNLIVTINSTTMASVSVCFYEYIFHWYKGVKEMTSPILFD